MFFTLSLFNNSIRINFLRLSPCFFSLGIFLAKFIARKTLSERDVFKGVRHHLIRFTLTLSICLLLNVTSFSLHAQEMLPFFKTINTQNGLSHNKVNKIIEDQRGFIWMATEDGLNRFDGRYFKIFRRSEQNDMGISGNIINDIYEDKQGVLWIATADGGLTKYDYRQPAAAQFKRYRFLPGQKFGIPENNILRIVESNGSLWLATSKSYVVRFNKATERFDVPVKSGTRAIIALKLISRDSLLVGRAGGGVLIINTRTLDYFQDSHYLNLYKRQPHSAVSGIFQDKQKRLWLSSWDNKLYRYNKGQLPSGYKYQVLNIQGIKNDEITPYAQDNIGRVWMGSKKSGLVISTDDAKISHLKQSMATPGSLASDHVRDILIDKRQIVWIATDKGVSVFNPLFSAFRQFALPRLSEDITVNDFYSDGKGNLFIATSRGLFIKNNDRLSLQHQPLFFKGNSLNITKIFVDVDGTFYLGTDYSLFIYDRQTGGLSLLPNTHLDPVMKRLFSSRIVSIIRDTIDRHPVLIVSPYGHYFTYYDLSAKRWISRTDLNQNIIKKFDLKDNLIEKIIKIPKGKTLLATNKSGLGIWDPGKGTPVKYFVGDEKKPSKWNLNHIYDITMDGSNGYWVSSYGGGLNHFNAKDGRFFHVPLSSNLTEGMEKDASGTLWMIANGHLHTFQPAKKVYSCYILPGMESSGGLRGYLYKDEHDRIYAASLNSFVEFQPAKVPKIQPEPAVFFTDFKVFNTSQSHLLNHRVIHLDYKQNYFSVEFSAPDFNGDNVFYAYKLEGFDKNWEMAGKRNTASYVNLPGGTYVFKVRATNWQSEQVGKYISVIIIINPPYWTRWWFSIILLVALGCFVFLLYFLRIKEILKRQSIRNGLAQDLHDNIGSTLSSVLVYTEVAKTHLKQHREEALLDSLDNIQTVSTEMIAEMSDIVWAITPKNDSVQGIIDRVKSYALPLCAAKGIKIRVPASSSTRNVLLNMKARKNLYLLLKEAINNAVKYADCKVITLEFFQKRNFFIVKLNDDGTGFCLDSVKNKQNDLSGNGLENMQTRANELCAKFEILTGANTGTSLTLIIPLRNNITP